MHKPIVAIVGRPNVGKSTLFNRISGRRIAITEDTPGVTRDRLYIECDWLENKFILIDTGGIDFNSEDDMLIHIRKQAEVAIDTADVILFIVDGKTGITSTDREIAQILRKQQKKVIVVANKMDKHVSRENIYEFYELGFEEIIDISAAEALGIGDMLDAVTNHFPSSDENDTDDETVRIAFIGKPNVGKSSLVNRILGEERTIVSNIPGTTRDSVDSYFKYNDRDFALIDTAGIRKKSKINENVERYSVIRSFSAIERSDICIIVLDADEGIFEQDIRVAGYAHESGKGIIIVLNKWDLIDADDRIFKEKYTEVKNKFGYIDYAPVLTVSAMTGKRINKILDTVLEVDEYRKKRITTGVLNDVINDAVLMNPPRAVKGKRLKIFYASQVSASPPKFIFFVNDKSLVHFSYTRYLENKIRENFLFYGNPIIIEYRSRGE